MFNATVKSKNKKVNIAFNSPALISEIMEQGGFYMRKPCGGCGKCGKCKVKVFGILSEPTDKEKKILSEKEISSGIRLACTTYAKSNITIYFDEEKKLIALAEGTEPEFEINPILTNKNGYGCAVDIGTTTIAAYLYNFPEGECLKSVCLPNTQARYGADVISRMNFCENTDGLKKLNKEIKNQINKITEIFNCQPEIFVITGNTVMLHIYRNINPHSMANYPFTPQTLFGKFYGNCYIPKCISAYVGADTVTAIIASDMQKDSKSLLLDIGTNGEIVLKNGSKYICTSVAAGPAFEGADISMGMTASEGAISKVWVENGKICYETIGNAKASGICGTGITDAVSVMLESGFMDKTGYIDNDFSIGSSGITITQKDIRQIQLAKAAIKSGTDILLRRENVSYNEIEKVYIAGGFGSYINKYSAANIGLIPAELTEKAVAIGNAAGIGATMLLRSKKLVELSERIAENAVTVNLNDESMFNEQFINNMNF